MTLAGWGQIAPRANPAPEGVAPQAFSPGHYKLLEEYSPFVKSLESGKVMEKSPELVIVGYGRLRGEDHVIVQQKDESEKREKIGVRWGSSTFPFRLLAVTNVSDRKTFKATLEDRNGRRREIGYANEIISPPPAGTPSGTAGGGSSSTPVPSGGAAASGGGFTGSPLTNVIGRPPVLPPPPPTVENLQNSILDLTEKINNPATTDVAKKIFGKQLEQRQRQLETLQNAQDIPATEVAPPPVP